MKSAVGPILRYSGMSLCLDDVSKPNRLFASGPGLNLQLEAQFMSRDLDLWDYQLGVTLDFSRPGEPTDMPYIAESCRRNQPTSAKEP